MTIFLQGFAVSAGLIIAIGAQNAFLLTQSVRRNHAMLIALICAGADILLIGLGLAGMGRLLSASPEWVRWISWAGALFLAGYGALSLRSALRGGRLETGAAGPAGRRAIVLTTLAVTFLNPHAYLDTLLLIGGIGGRYPVNERLVFGGGAAAASIAWFLTLALAGPVLAPLLRRRAAWRILDTGIGLMMLLLAVGLVRQGLAGF